MLEFRGGVIRSSKCSECYKHVKEALFGLFLQSSDLDLMAEFWSAAHQVMEIVLPKGRGENAISSRRFRDFVLRESGTGHVNF